ncbi:hypothetical protein [Streptomyces sp. NPDC088258]|uniref:RIFT barrel domain-containing protein n=1 Tax=Streptomyces sp. NPDC088258 TaxID=3365849 RepID=UPI00380B8B29
MPWSRGSHPAGTAFALTTEDGRAVPAQTWPTRHERRQPAALPEPFAPGHPRRRPVGRRGTRRAPGKCSTTATPAPRP